MAVIKNKYNRAVITTWTPINRPSSVNKPSLWAIFLARLLRILDGDPEKAYHSSQMTRLKEKTRTDVDTLAGRGWY